jgi:hypothetical protein
MMASITLRCSKGRSSPKRSIYSGPYASKIFLIVVMVASVHQVVDDAICVFMALGSDVEVDHGGVQALMTQVLSNATDIDSFFQQVGGIAVAEGVDRDALCDFKLF